jgi:ATP-dependent DNA ligase
MFDIDKQTIYDIIEELNWENGSNYKLDVLRRYQDNELLKRVLKLTYDKVAFNFYVTNKNINREGEWNQGAKTLEEALDILENELATRNYTGNAAIELLEALFNDLSKENAKVLELILNRDLRINLGRKQINKVFKKLITEFPYMRCSLMDKINRITYPAIIQEKLDGTYRSIVVNNGNIEIYSRSGEKSNYPNFIEKLQNLPNGVYIGEFMIKNELDRFKANGLLNSDTEPENIYAVTWDYLTLDEWKEGKSKTDYKLRLKTLAKNLTENGYGLADVTIAKTRFIDSLEDAKEFYLDVVALGGEGAVIKNLNNKFKNGTATDNIKMKEEAVSEFIITGFQEGTGRLEGTLGALEVISGDEKVISKVSGFTDKIRTKIWNERDILKGTIISVKYNGVSKAKGSDIYSLMFPVFEDFRPDKEQADDLDYIKNALK